MGLYTFGYEGLSIARFIQELSRVRIQRVIDVRELPLSRKRGFSKTSLSLALHASGIEYEHIRALGCPRPIRNRFKVDRDWEVYKRGFTAHLSAQTSALNEVAETERAVRICLVCFEADFRVCHRSLVAVSLERLGAPRAVNLSAKRATPVVRRQNDVVADTAN
ncbi:MAG: DUF488 domain-containing protein [Candidatus Binataceae bacterium]